MSRADLLDTVRLMLAKPSLWNPRSPRAADGSQALTAWWDAAATGGVQSDGAVSFTAACKHYLSVADSATVSATTVLDLCLWVYLESVGANRVFVAKGTQIGTAANLEYCLYYSHTGTNFKFSVSNGSTITTVTDTGAAPSTATWYFLHCGLKADGTLFISRNNGAEITSASCPAIQDGANAFVLGCLTTDATYCDGRLDSLALSKTTPSTAEVTALYNAGAGRTYADLTSANGLATFASNLVSWWDFDEETGTRYDAKGTNHLVPAFDELVTNGTFTGNSTGWTEGTGWAYGTNNEAGTAATGNLSQSLAAVAAKKYAVTFTITVTGGSLRFTFGGVTGTTRDATGTFYELATATSTASLVIDPVADFTGTIDDISVKSAEIVRAAGIAKSAATGETTLGAELLTNGGFETLGAGGADVWGTWIETAGSGTIADETTAIKAGLHAAKLSYATGESEAYNAITTTALTAYRLTFWTRGDGTRGGQYKVYDATGGADIVAKTATGVTGTTYTQVVVEFTTPASCVSTRIYLYSPASAGDAYFDDVSLKQVYAGPGACWCDQSGNGNHLTQTTESYKPTTKLAVQNSRAGLDFDGSDDVLSNAADLIGAGDVTVFGVLNAEGWGARILGQIVNNGQFIFAVRNSGSQMYASSNAGTVAASGTISLGTTYVAILTRTSGGVVNFFLNGALSGTANQASGTPAAGTPTYVGNRAAMDRSFNGNFYDLGIYKGTILSAAQITALSRYLGSKWGITVA